MADNSRKTPLVASQDQFVRRKINNALQLTGKALPCHVVAVDGPIVTIAFDINTTDTIPNVTVPIFGSIYAQAPTQINDKGVVFSVDVYLGGISGLGGGTADLGQRANLSSLVFFPVGNKNWEPSPNASAYLVQGPDGVILRDTGGASVITLTPTEISLNVGGHSILINSSGVTIDGKVFLTHMHIGVQSGGSDTGGVA